MDAKSGTWQIAAVWQSCTVNKNTQISVCIVKNVLDVGGNKLIETLRTSYFSESLCYPLLMQICFRIEIGCIALFVPCQSS